MVMTDIEVVYAQLYYNILLGRSYMYTMNAICSLAFHITIFPFNGKIVTLNHLNYYYPHANTNPENILPMIGEVSQSSCVDISLGVHKYSDLLGAY